MIDFITQYWLTFIFGLFGASMMYIIKKYFSQKKIEQSRGKDDFKEEMKEYFQDLLVPIDDKFTIINSRFDKIEKQLDINKNGILSGQKKIFYQEAEELLEPNHAITVEEFELCCKDHSVYNSLGGNDLGDELFESVQNKFNSQSK